jgi:hypothetical protein
MISNVMPLSYAVQALDQVGRCTDPTGTMWRDLLVGLLCTIAALALAAAWGCGDGPSDGPARPAFTGALR